jgi:hypothetical protein
MKQCAVDVWIPQALAGGEWSARRGDPRTGFDDAEEKFLSVLGLELRPLG